MQPQQQQQQPNRAQKDRGHTETSAWSHRARHQTCICASISGPWITVTCRCLQATCLREGQELGDIASMSASVAKTLKLTTDPS